MVYSSNLLPDIVITQPKAQLQVIQPKECMQSSMAHITIATAVSTTATQR